jgi:hypothetical protein
MLEVHVPKGVWVRFPLPAPLLPVVSIFIGMTLVEFFDPRAVSFKEIGRADVKDFIEKHYLGVYPAAAMFYVGIYYNDNFVGMIIYGKQRAPLHRIVFTDEAGMTHHNLMELQRLFLDDDETKLPKDARKNLAGYAITKGNELCAQRFPDLKAIVSYSDPGHHSGAVYKATNAIYQGRSRIGGWGGGGKDRWVYPVGSASQRSWVRKNLRTNLDWKAMTEAVELFEEMKKDLAGWRS